eukprot:3110546-Ditylum_brightwellii.AAC.1
MGLSTMDRINNVRKNSFGGHWQITGAMHIGGKFDAKRHFGIHEFYEENIAKNKDVQHIYEEIETRKSYLDVRYCAHVVDEDVKVLNNWLKGNVPMM